MFRRGLIFAIIASLFGSILTAFVLSVIAHFVFLGDTTVPALLSARTILVIPLVYFLLWFLVRKSFGVGTADNLLINISLLLGFALVLGIIAEFGLRLIYHDVTTTAENQSYFSTKWIKTVHYNAWGFREKDFVLAKPSGVYRIAVIGDSLTYGQGIDVQDRFTNILQKRLNNVDHTRTYEVLNFARPGAETVDHLHVLKDRVSQIQPDFLLLQWYINDVTDKDDSNPSRPLILIPKRLQKESALFYLLHRQLSVIQRGWLNSHDDYMLAHFGDVTSASSVKAAKTLKTFINTCKKKQVPLGLVLFSESYFHPQSKLDFLLERVLQVCLENGLTCSDTRPVLAAYQGKPELWANRLDPHPSAFANRLVADQLMQTFGNTWLAK